MFGHLFQAGPDAIGNIDQVAFTLPLPQLLAVSAVLGINDHFHLELRPQHGLGKTFLLIHDGFSLQLKVHKAFGYIFWLLPVSFTCVTLKYLFI